MKSGQITHYIEIAVIIDYHIELPDGTYATLIGPHVIVDGICYPPEGEIYDLIGKEADTIRQSCLDDAKEEP